RPSALRDGYGGFRGSIPRPGAVRHGRAKATTKSPSFVLSAVCPPAAITTSCRPLGVRYVMGVAWALAGSSPLQRTLPFSTSKARNVVSGAAPRKINPPAVGGAPPRFTEPGIDGTSGEAPSGTSQRTSPVARFTAVSAPHGGGLQGAPLGDVNASRYIP